MTTYRDLRVWQRAMDLLVSVYAFSRTLPVEERYGLCAQINRAVVSIPANVAEGHCRRTTRAFINHVSIALGSFGELETLLEACRRLEYGRLELLESCGQCAAETGRMLYALHSSLERSRGRKRGLLYSILLVVGVSYLATLASSL